MKSQMTISQTYYKLTIAILELFYCNFDDALRSQICKCCDSYAIIAYAMIWFNCYWNRA